MGSNKKQLLDVLSEVKTRVQDKLGIVDFPMPQFIIIGSQSVGKSRLIEALAGEQFNFISGSLGSRRPTVLEFRNLESGKESKWYIRDMKSNQWVNKPTKEVMEFVGEAHESLGMSVSKEPIYVKIESPGCVDMQIVDLPGYRGYSHDDNAKKLADAIVDLNGSFLNDVRNVILCVEEAGDAANLSSLQRVREVDKEYRRTILVRNKLDKYYNDLDSATVQQWLEGRGDLPKTLTKYALSLPHWGDGVAPKPLSKLREETSKKDLKKFESLGCSQKYMEGVGFNNFSKYMEKRTERMFVEAIGPVLTKLKDLEGSMTTRGGELKEELDASDPNQILGTVRACGSSFAECLNHVMDGVIRSSASRQSLDDELRAFNEHHRTLGDSDEFESLPSSDFNNLEDYIDFLRSDIAMPTMDVQINGGAQFSRLMFEVETFLRFSDIGTDIRRQDVLQSFGIAMGSVTWFDVVVKLLSHDGHIPLQRRISYIGERVKWFFQQQKAPVLEFMSTLKGSPQEKLYSTLYTKHAKMIQGNPTIKKLIFDTFDDVLDRQLKLFLELFRNTVKATFTNPWVFLKKTTADLTHDDGEPMLSTMDDTKRRIPWEMKRRTGVERTVAKWVSEVPMEPHKIDDAVDQVQLLVHTVYSAIRSTVCDQVELFCESFFKLPLLRRLVEDMNKIEMDANYTKGIAGRRGKLEKEATDIANGLVEVKDCLKILSDFQLNTMVGS